MSEQSDKLSTQALITMSRSLKDLVRIQEAMMKAIVEIGIIFKEMNEDDEYHIQSLTDNQDGTRTAVFSSRDPNQLALDDKDMNGE